MILCTSANQRDRMTSIRAALDERPMSASQVSIVAICVLLNMLDGYDVLAMAFTASGVTAEWGLSGTQLGFLLSAGLFGMAGGSLFVAPSADYFGRRGVILFCLGIITVGMLLAGMSRNALELGALRALTGIGIGGLLASASVITSEYSNNRWRTTALSMVTAGYPVGAAIGGTIAAVLIGRYGWRSAFYFGAFVSLLALPIVAYSLPESVDYLITRQPRNALQRLNSVLRRIGLPELSALPIFAAEQRKRLTRASVPQLLSPSVLRSTMLIWTAFFMLMASFYFVNSWTPRLLTASGMTAQQGIAGGVLLSIGGIIGTVLFGVIGSAKIKLKILTAAFLLGSAVLVATFGAFSQLSIALWIGVVMGAILNGAMAGPYALAPMLYPAEIRATGMGWAIGIGRIGAILSPVLAGFLLDRQWQPSELYYLFVIPLVIAAIAVLLIGPAYVEVTDTTVSHEATAQKSVATG
jgi:benzoate transport